jgi:hypothetical protein
MVQTVEMKQVCRAASTVLFPELEFGVKPCGKYTREDFCSRERCILSAPSLRSLVGEGGLAPTFS